MRSKPAMLGLVVAAVSAVPTSVMAQGIFDTSSSDVRRLNSASSQAVRMPGSEGDLIQRTRDQFEGITPASARLPGLTHLGQIELRPHLEYSAIYGTDIPNGTNSVRPSSVIQSVEPGLLIEFGQHLTIDYTATERIYSSPRLQNNLGHHAELQGASATPSWLLTLLQSYDEHTLPLAETGTNTASEMYHTAISATRQLNSDLTLSISGDQRIRDASAFASSRVWSGLVNLNYSFWSRWSAGIGGGGGMVKVPGGIGSTFETANFHLGYKVTEVVHVSASVGFEERQFDTAASPSRFSPTFNVSGVWQATPATAVSLIASKSVGESFIRNEVLDLSEVGLQLNHRLPYQLELELNGVYRNVDFISASTATSAGRGDDSFSARIGLSRPFLQRGRVEIFYHYLSNKSTLAVFAVNSEQFGLKLSYKY